MRILHLDPDDTANPLAGGGPVRTWEIYRRLARRHEVTVLTPTFPGSTPEQVKDGIRYLRLGRKLRDHGSSHHLTYLFSLPGAVRRTPHDLLVEDFMPPFSATWTPLFRRRDRPLVASVQWFFARAYTRQLKLPFHWGEDYGVRLYRHFVVLTPSMRERILARHPDADCRVIPNGVDDALFAQPLSVGQGILFLGRIEVQAKGIDLLLQAYARLPAEERPGLTLAGTVQQPELLDHWLTQTGLQGQVRVTGAYSAAQRLDLLRSHRVLAMPSRHETFGMTIAEANAAGRIAVVWDQAPMNEVASSACVRVPAHDVAAYAAALQALCNAPDEHLLRRGEQARQHAQPFNWDRVAAAQEDYYRELLQASPQGRLALPDKLA
jgi:glycosyltransferase involved in cell wall biosynthesis